MWGLVTTILEKCLLVKYYFFPLERILFHLKKILNELTLVGASVLLLSSI